LPKVVWKDEVILRKTIYVGVASNNEVLYIYLAMTTKVINVVLVWKGIRE
jgi:hypothetical protein